MDVSMVWIAIGSCATGLMAIATFSAIFQNWLIYRTEQKRTNINEAIIIEKKIKGLINDLQEDMRDPAYQKLPRALRLIECEASSLSYVTSRIKSKKLFDKVEKFRDCLEDTINKPNECSSLLFDTSVALIDVKDVLEEIRPR